MASPIKDYALIGNRSSCALVSRDGSIDWLGFPRFDSDACFAALLGTPENGRWLIAPVSSQVEIRRRYRPGTLILETEFATPEGTVVLTDCMARRGGASDLLRLLRGTRGRVRMRMELRIRFQYGEITPWVSRLPDGRLRAVVGSDQIILATPVEHTGQDLKTVAVFDVKEGQEIPFALTWEESYHAVPDSPDVAAAISAEDDEWKRWSSRCNFQGEYSEAVLRSLITLRALTDSESGGIVAAATTSLPEEIGGSRNWDYRYSWLRDSTFTLLALIESGYCDEAREWRAWLMRAIGGAPDKMQIMYGVRGDRRLTEYELHHLPGYANSRPVRIGNAASGQLQLDVFGEVLDCLYQARRTGLVPMDGLWDMELALVKHLETLWRKPDEGIWEVRGGQKQFTWSKIMAWVAFDRAIRTIEQFGAGGPVEKLRQIRQQIRNEIEGNGFDADLNSFVQSFGSKKLDASLLLIPIVGFLPAEDPRVRGTVERIERQLMRDGFVERYDPESGVDGMQGREGVFLACSFWLADNYVLQGRCDDARKLFAKLLDIRNDVGLLSEEYDTADKRLVGNFPQAFSHVALVNTALNLTRERKPAQQRGS